MDEKTNTGISREKQVLAGESGLTKQLEEFMAWTAATVEAQRACRSKRGHTLVPAIAAASEVGLPPWILAIDPIRFQCSCDFLLNFPEFLSLILNDGGNRLTAEDRRAISRRLEEERGREQFEDLGEGARQ
jgi:hypothetical protein